MIDWRQVSTSLSFLNWVKELKYWPNLRRDIIAGLTVAMLLIPQSLAYAQLAGLPIYYGLYAAFIPPIVASIFASSRYLSTGPVAITSLLTASVLQTMAVSGSEEYISYAITLCLLAGIIQCGLGMLRLGKVMNFISYPVMLGFVNAAAIIIALAQLGNLLGINTPPSTQAIDAILQVIQDIPHLINFASMAIGILAIILLFVGQYYFRRWPTVLIVALITTLIAWMTNYQQQRTVKFDQIVNPSLIMLIKSRANYEQDSQKLIDDINQAQKEVDKVIEIEDTPEDKLALLMNQLSQAKWRLEQRIIRDKIDRTEISRLRLKELNTDQGSRYFIEDKMTPIGHVGESTWQIDDYYLDYIDIRTGGEVVGSIPVGLPSFRAITLDSQIINRLLIGALAIALIGFMESVAVSKRYAIDKREPLSINQELFSQGFAKICGSFFQSMPVSGGFTRTAINVYSGARTNFSNMVAGLTVGLVLLVGTSLFYYLPKATLAAIIIVSVISLINFPAMLHIFRISRNEGFLTLFTFVATLLLAPRIDYAILLGVLVSLVIYLNEGMQPKMVELVRQGKNDWGPIRKGQSLCYLISMIRFGGSLYFANATYFADRILELVRNRPKIKYIIVDCIRINKIDASGLQAIENIANQLDEAGIEIWFVRMRQSVKKILLQSHCPALHKESLFFSNHKQAIDKLGEHLGSKHMNHCPLEEVDGKH